MLLQLAIQHYATVDSLEIDFGPGMSAISGETGAGKSIMLDGLGLTLGDRADKSVVRSGARKAEICAEFDISNIAPAKAWLSKHELVDDADPERCLLRRVVGDDGRSKGFINGSPATLGDMKTLGEMLIDIHSQHEHQSLLQRATHQRLLDDFSVTPAALKALSDSYRDWHKNQQRIDALSAPGEDNTAQLQLLRYQLSELDELALGEDELDTLEQQFKALSNADETLASARLALDACQGSGDDSSASDLLAKAHAVLGTLPASSPQLANASTLIESAAIALDEAVSDLRGFVDGFEADPERLEEINSRLGAIHDLARKHRVAPKDLPSLTLDLRAQLEGLENSDVELETLLAADAALREAFDKAAQKVSKQRKAGGKNLATSVNEQLLNLGMPHARLEVSLNPVQKDRPSSQGAEIVEFLVSTNPGQEAKPLIKIASGGELSRISLAIQVITAQTSRTPSLVFDEVDVGIGGGIAKVVGELLRKLGENSQVLCVTHQAQVAGQGHNHFFVSKEVVGKAAGQSKKGSKAIESEAASTLTRITRLDDEARLREVARMLGGDDCSAESLAHAKQMLAS